MWAFDIRKSNGSYNAGNWERTTKGGIINSSRVELFNSTAEGAAAGVAAKKRGNSCRGEKRRDKLQRRSSEVGGIKSAKENRGCVGHALPIGGG